MLAITTSEPFFQSTFRSFKCCKCCSFSNFCGSSGCMQQIHCSKTLFAKQPSGSVICNNDASLVLAATWIMRWCVRVHRFPRLDVANMFHTHGHRHHHQKNMYSANNQNQPQTTTTNNTAIGNHQISFWPRCIGLSWPTSEGMLVHVGRALAKLFMSFPHHSTFWRQCRKGIQSAGVKSTTVGSQWLKFQKVATTLLEHVSNRVAQAWKMHRLLPLHTDHSKVAR